MTASLSNSYPIEFKESNPYLMRRMSCESFHQSNKIEIIEMPALEQEITLEQKEVWCKKMRISLGGLAFLDVFGHNIEAIVKFMNERIAVAMGLENGISVEHPAGARNLRHELSEKILSENRISAVHEVNKPHGVPKKENIQESAHRTLYTLIRDILRYNIKDPVQRMEHLFHISEQLEDPMVVIHANVLPDLEIALEKKELEQKMHRGAISKQKYNAEISNLPSPEEMEIRLRAEECVPEQALARAFAYLVSIQRRGKSKKIVRIAFENTVLSKGEKNLTLFENPSELAHFLEQMGENGRYMGIALDLAHLAITNERLEKLGKPELGAHETIEAIAKRLLNVHLNGYYAKNADETKFQDSIPMHKSRNPESFKNAMNALFAVNYEGPLVFELNPFGEHFGIKGGKIQKLLSCVRRPINRAVLGKYFEQEMQTYIAELNQIRIWLGLEPKIVSYEK